jgi:ligand-binding sensor domain-containing protein/signal transduction histidine kinase
LIDSSTSRERLPRQLLRLIGAAAMIVVCAARPAHAIDPNRTMSQYVRDAWTRDNGFPQGPVYSITQTPDGYLWIGTAMGLIRFDGLNFVDVQSDVKGLPVLRNVFQLVVDHRGDLWTLLRRPTLLRYRDGEFFDMSRTFGPVNTSAIALGRSVDGAPLLWVQELAGVIALRGDRYEVLGAQQDLSPSPVLSLAQTGDGDIWVGTRDTGLYRVHAGRVTKIIDGLPDLKVNALAPARTNALWVGTDNGLARWDDGKLTLAVPPSLRSVQVLALLVDRDGNLWIGTNSDGLARLSPNGEVSWMQSHEVTGHDAVTALFEDREGNLWAGGARGLERIRDSAMITYARAEGLPTDRNGPLCVDADKRLWFAPLEGGLWWMRDGHIAPVDEAGLAHDVVYALACGKDGVWVGRQHGGLTQLRSHDGAISAITYTTREGLAQNSVYALHESRDGSIWAGTLSAGVSRLNHGRFTNYTFANGLAANTVASIAESADGTMWFGTPQGLSALRRGQWKTYGTQDGLPSDNINCLLIDANDVLWIGTANSLAHWRAGRAQTVRGPAELLDQINGIADDGHGSLWIASSIHVLRVNRDSLINGTSTDADSREFSLADGLRGVESVKRSRSVIVDAAGRIWFSTNNGISVVDPARLRSSAVPAIAHVQAIATDGSSLPVKGSILVPGGGKRLTIKFAGLSLSAPDRVRYRYRLEGFDSDWSGTLASREAIYTNLAPGPYRFRVMASNPDGLWSPREGMLAFEVEPLLWQTWWFRSAIVAACALVVMLVYRIRMRQLTRRLNLRFEERLAERTRIAQELHDTLLQGFLSVSMQVHVVSDSLPDDSHVKPLLGRALQRMGQVIEEGRNAVRGLRASKSASFDLEQAFSLVRHELGVLVNEDVDYRVIVNGQPRPLQPLLRDEVYRIGREALINAFRHSHARHIELELRYAANQFGVFVRDDGAGIDPQIAKEGREGHWGLSGMQERAARIGARLRIMSRLSAGTDIELIVPANRAYQKKSPAIAVRKGFVNR